MNAGLSKQSPKHLEQGKATQEKWRNNKLKHPHKGLREEWFFDTVKQKHMPRQVEREQREHLTHTVFFDLDETLWRNSQSRNTDGKEVLNKGKMVCGTKVCGNKRPYVDELLQMIQDLKTWEIIVYTAGIQPYAEIVCRYVFRNSRCTYRILSRNYCTNFNENCWALAGLLKPIGAYRNPNNSIIVDNSPRVVWRQEAHNLVPIKSWKDTGSDRDDNELLKVGHLIIELHRRAQRGETVRDVLREILCNDVALKATQDRRENIDHTEWALLPGSNDSGKQLSGVCLSFC